MRSKFKWIFTLILAFAVQISFAQEKNISGKVLDKDKEALPGVNIVVKGSKRGTQTDFDGNYSIKAKTGETLVFSFLGMKDKEVVIGASSSVNVSMESAEKQLTEVVVVAYGVQKKEAITGSVVSIKAKELETITSSNAVQGLVGKVAGVQITNSNGMPGEAPIVRFRGVSSITGSSAPLYVLDGVPFSGDVASINNQDIESMSFLKDASAAALYGNRGANGVIIITTKKGKVGELKLTLDTKLGFSSRAVKEMDLVDNEKEFYEVYYKALKNDLMFNSMQSDAVASVNAANTLISGGPYSLNYNSFNIADNQLIDPVTGKVRSANLKYSERWEDYLFNSGMFTSNTISVSGGTENSTQYLSIGYEKNEGYVVNSGLEKISSKLNLKTKIKNFINVGTNLAYSHLVQNYLDGYTGGSAYSNPFAWTRAVAPIYPVHLHDKFGNKAYDASGNVLYDDGTGLNANPNYYVRPYGSLQNPYATSLYDIKEFKNDNVFASAFLDIELAKDLVFSYKLSGDLRYSNNKSLDTPLYGDAKGVGGRVSYSSNRRLGVTHQQFLTYKKELKNHNFDILLGHESFERIDDYTRSERTKLLLPGSPYIDQAGTIISNNGRRNSYAVEGFLGRLNYDYDGKYYLNLNYRRDASSRFHPDNRWGTFYGAGISWIVTKEKLLSNIKWLNYLKLKASYGEQGNDNIANTSLNFDAERPYDDYFIVQGDFTQSSPIIFNPSIFLPNKELKWEKNQNTNLGFESSFLKDRLKVDFEYYMRKSDDLLYLQPLGPSSGKQFKPVNLGEMQNTGFEVTLDSKIFKKEDWSIDATFNITSVENKINKLNPNGKLNNFQIDPLSSIFILEEGGSRYDYYMRKFVGVNPSNGNAQFLKDDGTVTENYSEGSLMRIGKSAIPDFYGGFGLSGQYKGFDVNVNFAYQMGGYGYDSNYMNRMGTSVGEKMHRDFYKTWTPENTKATLPRFDIEDSRINYGTSTLGLIKSDYLSIQNISLGYDFKDSITQKFGMSKFRIYGIVDNVHLWSKRQGYDPRLDLRGGSDNDYSLLRTISFGLNMQF